MKSNPYNPTRPESFPIGTEPKQVQDRKTRLLLPMLLRGAILLAILGYGSAILGEAAYYAGGIGFNEVITPQRMFEAIAAVTPTDILQREYGPADWLTILGMLVLPVLRLEKFWGYSGLPMAIYLFLLLACGGWLGLVVLPFTPMLFWDPIDGEFFADGVARFFGIGLWESVLIALLASKRFELKKQV